MTKHVYLVAAVIAMTLGTPATREPAVAQTIETLAIRGHPQSMRLYGIRGRGAPVVVSSGDGGWIHLGPDVAEFLASHGFLVVGFDARAYLRSFTSGSTTLNIEDVPGDYYALAEYAARGSTTKPILIGVSEGAGLSVLAATSPKTKEMIGGVIALGLSDLNELGWQWRDSLIYLTHGAPNEPTFSVAALVNHVAPLPLAAIHSTRDEYVPLSEVQMTMQHANEPKRLWIVEAGNHRFSDNLDAFDERLLEAIAWVTRNEPH